MESSPQLSIVIVYYSMERELPRTLAALSAKYQLGISEREYEVIVIDNGSPKPINPHLLSDFGGTVRHYRIDTATPSPAAAINQGVALSRGEILGIMVDGAHIVTPGVLGLARSAFAAFSNPIVLTRYFYLGPGEQNVTVEQGYTQDVEDLQLNRIDWPRDGYRLFEIGSAYNIGGAAPHWLQRPPESNCIFMKRRVFEEIGGCDLRFDLPGGGLLNMDLYIEAAGLSDTVIVSLIGEGSFHQVHGGTTTSIPVSERVARVAGYREQYRSIRGREFEYPGKTMYYLGHLPTERSKLHRYPAAMRPPEMCLDE
jgi:hypothetical protein